MKYEKKKSEGYGDKNDDGIAKYNGGLSHGPLGDIVLQLHGDVRGMQNSLPGIVRLLSPGAKVEKPFSLISLAQLIAKA